MNIDRLIQQLRIHEGSEMVAYEDTTGHLTVGIGHNLDKRHSQSDIESIGADWFKLRNETEYLTEDQIEQLLEIDLEGIEDKALLIVPCYNTLNEVRQRVVCDMLFNLGPSKLKKFKNTIKHICRGEYILASEGMKASLWAKQVKGRASVLISMMRTGKDVYEFDSQTEDV